MKINTKIEFEIDPDEKLWDESDDDSKREYITERFKEYIEENIYEIINDIIKSDLTLMKHK